MPLRASARGLEPPHSGPVPGMNNSTAAGSRQSVAAAIVSMVLLCVGWCAASPAVAGTGNVIMVGGVDIVAAHKPRRPPTREAGHHPDNAVLLTDHESRSRHDLRPPEPAGRIEITQGGTFYVRVANRPLAVRGVMVPREAAGRSGSGMAHLPANFSVNIRHDDEAVYIGHVRYYLDESFAVTGIELEDNFLRAQAEFQKQYGGRYRLRKALLTQAP